MRGTFARLCLVVCLPAAALARPAPDPEPDRPTGARYVGGPADAVAKAAVDTVVVLGPWGSAAPANGAFETPSGAPDWNGWTTIDNTADNYLAWHADTFHAVTGNWSAWCGDPDLPSCSVGWDEVGGYGNNWNEYLEWRGTVDDPAQPCTVTVSAVANLDTEPGYDYAYITCEKSGSQFVDLWSGFGAADSLAIGGQTVYQPGEYLGDAGDEVSVLFRFISDGGFSGEDCFWPNDGAIQLDDVAITLSNGTGYATDFEDGTLGQLVQVVDAGVGNFAALWTGLDDLDPCRQNATSQVAFIDDGLVVPGTGGSPCISWCYGPGGWVVNTTGGLATHRFPPTRYPDRSHLDNAVISPPLAWPDPGLSGARVSYDVYRHEDLTADSPGVFYFLSVRSVDTGDPADLDYASWRRFYPGGEGHGGPDYHREEADVSGLLRSGATHVQVRLTAYQYGWYYGYTGNDATPAPYFDNVRLVAYDRTGPDLTANAGNLAGDAFPSRGSVDLTDLGANNVPVWTAYSYVWSGPYEPMTVTCEPAGRYGELTGPPQIHWRLQRNPLFDPWRTAGLPDQGSMDCTQNGSSSNQWTVALPDSGFLFPGDRLHYCFTATQTGGGADGTTILPADTTGFSTFTDYPAYDGGYDPGFSIRALPTVTEDPQAPGTYVTPNTLFWHDSGNPADWPAWTRAFHESGLLGTGDLDVFRTQAAAAGLKNGLGGRATDAQLAFYDGLIYTSGEMTMGTIHGLDPGSTTSPDAVRLDTWLRSGGKGLVAFGNDLASSLALGTAQQTAFLADWFGCTVDDRDVRPLIGGQTSPRVVGVPPNPVLSSVSSWVAYGGGCSSPEVPEGAGDLVRDRFDALVPAGLTLRIAEWAGADGTPGGWPYAAAVANDAALFGARVVLVPTDFPQIRTDPDEGAKAAPYPPARTRLLMDLSGWAGFAPDGPVDVTPVPEAAVFAVEQAPNPFNPTTIIRWSGAGSGPLAVRVYDVRGRLVRRLHEGPAPAAGAVTWDGAAADGGAMASGVYFYEVRRGDDVRVGKMALVK